jgi:hypothetical protein
MVAVEACVRGAYHDPARYRHRDVFLHVRGRYWDRNRCRELADLAVPPLVAAVVQEK